MSTTIMFTMLVGVSDPFALFVAAKNHLITVDLLSEEQANELLVDTGIINVGACVQTLADPGMSYPGTDIISSHYEEQA